MSRASAWFCRTTILITNVAAMAFIYSVALFKDNGTMLMPGLFIWIACIVLCSLTHTLLSGRERTVRFIMLVTAAFFAVQAVLCFVFADGYETFERVLFTIIFWIFSYYRCFLLVKKGMKQEPVTDNFDLSVIILLLAAACATMSKMEQSVLCFPAIAAVLSFAALICARADSGGRSGAGGESVRGSSIIVGAVILIAGAAAGAVALFSDAIRKGIRAFFSALITAVKWLFETVSAFLLRVFPPRVHESGEFLPGIEGAASGEGEGMTDMYFTSEWLFRGIFIGLVVLLIVVAVVRFVMGGRQKTAAAVVSAGTKRTKTRKRTLKAALARLSQRTRYLADFVVYRNTARGLFAWLLRRGLTLRVARKRGETPRAFIKRLSENCPAGRERLLAVSDLLDREFFGGGDASVTPHEIAAIRRELKTFFKNRQTQSA